ncbi:MAG: phage tail tape measure protein [Candidatus Binataceae bacterium]
MSTVREFLFGFKFSATDYVSPVLKNIEGNIKKLNESVANTARWREAGTNLALIGGGMAAIGGAGLLAMRSFVTASAAMQTEITHVATSLNDGVATAAHLVQVKEAMQKASVASGLSAVQEGEAYYIARSNMLNHTQALAAMTIASKLTIATTRSLADAQSQLEPTTRLMTTVYQDFGDKTKNAQMQMAAFADTMTKLQTQYAFHDISEVSNAMQYAIPLAKTAGISFNDMAGALAVLNLNLHGAEAGTAFEELVSKIQTGGKLASYVTQTAQGGIDLQKTVARIGDTMKGLSAVEEGRRLHALGFSERSIRGVALLLDKTKEYKATVEALGHSQGALDAAFSARSAGWDIQIGRAAAAWEDFKTAIGNQLMGPAGKLVTYLTEVVTWSTGIMSAHPAWVKFAALSAAVASSVLLLGGGLAIASGALMGFASFVPAVAAFSRAVRLTSIATKVWSAAQWLVNAAMDANPIGLLIIGVAALSVAIYELYKHWSAIEKLGSAMYAAGVHIVKEIGRGIMAGAVWAEKAISHVADKIRSYLPFSPAKAGPLTQLHHVRIIETIADSMKPAPALAAMTRVSRAIALAVPLTLSPMLAGAAFAGPRVAPRISPGIGASSYAPGRSGGSGAGGNVTINYAPNIQAGPGTDFKELMSVLRQHSRELWDMMESEQAHRARRNF